MIIRHTLNYTAVKLLPAIASMTALMIFTRLMTPEQYGEYSLTVNVTGTAVAILGSFLVIGLGRFEPATHTIEEKRRLHSTVIGTALLLVMAVIVLTAMLGMFDALPNLSVNYYFFTALFLLTLLLMLSQKLINANLKPKAYGVSLALKNILFLVTGAACLVAGYGVHGVLASLAVASLLALLPALKLWAKISWNNFDLKVLRRLWSYGAPLTLLYLFVMIISFSDRIFIDVMLGAEDVGLYSAGYDLTQYTIAVVASILHLAAFPIILKAYETEGEEKTKALLSVSIRILLLVMLPVTLGFIAVKEEVSAVFLGNEFSATSIMLIPLLAFSVLLATIKSYYFDYAFQITKTTWLQSLPPMLAAICNCVFNYLMIPKMGVIGAAYATLISYVLYLVLTVVLSQRVFKLPEFPWAYAAKICVASFIMMAAVSLVRVEFSLIPSLLTKIMIGVGVFCVCAFLLIKRDLLALLKSASEIKGHKNDF